MFSAVQIAYWLALSTWFGAVLFLAIAAPAILRTIRDADPTLPKVLSVNLNGQHSVLLAGTLVANLRNVLLAWELICAGVLLMAIVCQWFLIDISGTNVVLPIVRSAMYLAATALLVYDWRVLWPRIQKFRQEYIEHADDPDVANPALERFERYDRESVNVLLILVLLLLGMILFSGNIRIASTTFLFQ